jgi:heptosyltransferase-2
MASACARQELSAGQGITCPSERSWHTIIEVWSCGYGENELPSQIILTTSKSLYYHHPRGIDCERARPHMKVHTDCRYYFGFKPCDFHKRDGRLCEACDDYDKIETHILIIKLDALGDVLRTTSILPALNSKYQNSAITWVTRKNALTLLDDNEYIFRKYAVEDNYIEYILNQVFNLGICLDPDPFSASILSISKCDKKLGFHANEFGQVQPVSREVENWYLMGINDNLKKQNRMSYQKIIYEICKLDSEIEKPQIVVDLDSRGFSESFYENNELSRYRKLIGINTGGGKRWQYKKWILEHYIELIKRIRTNFPDIGIILLGGPEEREFNQIINSETGDLIVDAGCDNSLKEFVALIDLLDIFLTPDSLGMHIGVALGKITVVLVGPTSPWELDVFNRGEIIYNEDLDCVACYKSKCDKEVNCMITISPDEVFNRIRKYI